MQDVVVCVEIQVRVRDNVERNNLVKALGWNDDVVYVRSSEGVCGVSGIWLMTLKGEISIFSWCSVIENAVSVEMSELL